MAGSHGGGDGFVVVLLYSVTGWFLWATDFQLLQFVLANAMFATLHY